MSAITKYTQADLKSYQTKERVALAGAIVMLVSALGLAAVAAYAHFHITHMVNQLHDKMAGASSPRDIPGILASSKSLIANIKKWVHIEWMTSAGAVGTFVLSVGSMGAFAYFHGQKKAVQMYLNLEPNLPLASDP